MTRGKAILITDEKVYITVEFNGDMYPSGHGKTMYDLLGHTFTIADFEQKIKQFNIDEDFNYPEDLIAHELSKDEFLKLSNMTAIDYFDFWFSDYLYFINRSDKKVTIYDVNGKRYTLETNMRLALCFGHTLSKEDMADLL